jgi:hypothetical protein
MTNQELFSQAIADAKAVRDAAVANAKAALEETFTPKIMSMLSAKLNEMEEDMEEGKEVEEEGYGKTEEGHEATIGYGAASQKPQIEGEEVEENTIEEADLDEILAQLEAEEKGKQEEGKEEVEEAKKEVEEGKDEVEEAKKKDNDKKEKVEESLEEADDDSEEGDSEEAESDDEVTELTVDELKDIIRDVLKDVMGGTEAGEEAGEEIDLDVDTELGDETGEEEVEDEESISLEELLAELDKEDGKKVEEKKEVEEGKEKVEEKKEEVEEAKKDLEEAIATIKTLQAELNEVNLLNAKLLYTNKIFKSKSLNEAQKVKVLKSLDRATNVKEAKNIYETLSEALTVKTAKSSIKESVGFASKAVGVAPTQPIVESDTAIRRMQQLAGIIK